MIQNKNNSVFPLWKITAITSSVLSEAGSIYILVVYYYRTSIFHKWKQLFIELCWPKFQTSESHMLMWLTQQIVLQLLSNITLVLLFLLFRTIKTLKQEVRSLLKFFVFVVFFSFMTASWLNIIFCDWISKKRQRKDVKDLKLKIPVHYVHFQILRREFKYLSRIREFLTNLSF